MPQSVDDLLEEWESIKIIGCPTAIDISDVSKFAQARTRVDELAQSIRNSRLVNDKQSEMRTTSRFVEAYYDFNKDFAFRALKK